MKTLSSYILLFATVGLLSGCFKKPIETNNSISTGDVLPITATFTSVVKATQPNLVLETSESTSDQIVYPTSTYLVPTAAVQTQYELEDWNPQRANQLITILRAYPDNLGFAERGYHDYGYYAASSYALFAQQEAQLQFPDSSFTEEWAWDAGYRMAQIGDPDVIELYAQLVTQTLNTGMTDVQRLERWFKDHETRLQLSVSMLPRITELQDNYLIEISDPYHASGIFIWLVRDGSASFSTYPLPASDHGGFGDFGFFSAEGIEAEWRDVTGDGIAEIITTHAYFPGSGDAITTSFDIFDIRHAPPRKIQFIPPISSQRHRTWSVVPDSNSTPHMQFEFVFDRITCPFKIGKDYRWNGESFELVEQTYPGEEQIMAQEGPECLDQLVMTLLWGLQSGDIDAAPELDKLISDWPYSDSGWPPNDENTPDARDKVRFMMGLYLAFHGQVDSARYEMDSILSNPATPTSKWIPVAEDFLAHFHTAQDLSEACIAVKVCADFLDIDQIASLWNSSESDDIIDFTRQTGIEIKESGFFDANGDDRTDRWLLLEEGEGIPLIWLFIKTDKGYQPLFLGNWPESTPTGLQAEDPFQRFPVFAVTTTDGPEMFIFDSDPIFSSDQPLQLCDHLRTRLNDLQNDLMSGISPLEIIEELSEINSRLDVACGSTSFQVQYLRPYLQYLLGLAYELNGDAPNAAENFLAVWQSYPDSPYAIMARAKLRPTK